MAVRFLHRSWESHELLRVVRAAVLLGALATLAFGWFDTRYSIQSYEESTLERAKLQARLKARAASEAIQATVGSIDFVLKSAREAINDGPQAFEHFARRAPEAFSSEVVLQLFRVDANGFVVYSTRGPRPRAFVGDRDYFLALEASDVDRVVITPPLPSEVNNRWTLLVARAIWRDGGFDGVIVASVPLEAWTARFRRLEVGVSDVLTLVDADGRLIVRTQEVTHMGPDTPRLGAALLAQLSDPQGSFVGNTGFDDVVRVYGWSPLRDGMVMMSGLALDDVFALVRTQRQRALTRAAILSGAFALAVFALLLALKRYQVVVERLAAREAHYRKVFDTMVEGVMVIDAQQRILSVNPAFCAITGNARDDLMRQGFARIAAHDAGIAALHRLIDSSDAERGEAEAAALPEGDFEGVRPDGTQYIAHARVSPLSFGASEADERVVMIAEVTELRHRDREIWRRANFDSLTGLANRALMHDRLERMIRHARRRQSGVTVLFLDLDRFKPVNDDYGHEIGDLLLIEVARRLESLFREEDTVVRLGGDEFVVLMAEDGRGHAAHRAAEAIVRRLSETFRIAGHDLSISASVGFACFPVDGDSGEALLDRADRAMYESKRGREAAAR